MKLATLTILLVLVGSVAAVRAGDRSRFDIQADEAHDLGRGGATEIFAVHDTGSGIELICVRKVMFEGISCTPTGRNWR